MTGRCPNCARSYRVPEDQVGKRRTCLDCGSEFRPADAEGGPSAPKHMYLRFAAGALTVFGWVGVIGGALVAAISLFGGFDRGGTSGAGNAPSGIGAIVIGGALIGMSHWIRLTLAIAEKQTRHETILVEVIKRIETLIALSHPASPPLGEPPPGHQPDPPEGSKGAS